MGKKMVLRNILTSVLLQILTLVNGLIVPKIILINFGSEINGLVSSITQFLNYITLLEGGIGAVVMASLYKPLAENDYAKISSIVKSSERFFKTIALIFLWYALLLSVIGPVFLWKDFNWKYTSLLVLVLALNLFVQYYFSITYKILINADQKTYIVSIAQMCCLIVNLIFTILIAKWFPEIHILKFANAIAYCIQPIIFNGYIKKHYCLDRNALKDETALRQRWDGFGQNIAYVIHMNTDVTVLTIFSSLSSVSIYSVFNLVVVALKNFVTAISSAILPSVGNVLVKEDNKKSNDAFDLYELCIGMVTTFLFSCGAVLSNSFVSIYTKGINDATYYQPKFAILIMAAIATGCIREPYINVANAAGHFKKIAIYAYLEAIVNIVLSIILVHSFGIIGVAIGTLIACLFRYIVQVLYIRKNILFRPLIKSIKSSACYVVVFFLSIMCSKLLINVVVDDYLSWILYAMISAVFVIIIMFILLIIFYRPIVDKLIRRIIKNDT